MTASLGFFIRKPIFTGVCSTLVVLAGVLTVFDLPVALYPDLLPPQIRISSSYFGASAETVETAVTSPIELELNGLEGMRHITSSSTNDGNSEIDVGFDVSRSLDAALIDVQNRVARAAPRLPPQVVQAGIRVTKTSSGLMTIILYGTDGRLDVSFISNFADVTLREALRRVPGVGEVRIFGERKFAMRVWLDPTELARRRLTPGDVVQALREQNIQVAAGQIGEPPADQQQAYQIPIRSEGRLVDASEFAEVVVRRGKDGAVVRVRDVGRVELGSESYRQAAHVEGRPAVVLNIVALPTANVMEVQEAVMAELKLHATRFPPGLDYRTVFDSTLVIRESIREVLWTFLESIALVMLVMFVFLHDWRTVVITALTLPVSLVGTFAFLKIFGFSINIFTLFGLTLATGLVVDDAIVVIENIERHREASRLKASEAAHASMREVGAAVVAISIALIAVFVPVSFFPGVTGAIYRQFALTIGASVTLSTFCALTLTPALSALILTNTPRKTTFHRRVDSAHLRLRDAYGRLLRRLLRKPAIVVGLFATCLASVVGLFRTMPRGFLPSEDAGYFFIHVQGPEGMPVERTRQFLSRLEQLAKQQPETNVTFTLAGDGGAIGSGSNLGYVGVVLKHWRERPGSAHTLAAVVDRIRPAVEAISEVRGILTLPSPIRGAGKDGFQLYLQDTSGGRSLADLATVVEGFVSRARNDPTLRGVFSPFAASTPIFEMRVDRQRAKALGVPVDQAFSTVETLMGGQYVNDFQFGNRVYRVYAQADHQFRDHAEDIGAFYVRSDSGDMVPLESVARLKPQNTASQVRHYNLFRAAEITGQAATGKTTGDALDAVQALVDQELPEGMATSWGGLSRQQVDSGGQTYLLFSIGVLFVFLVLAALYESLVLPGVIILSVPLAVLGALGLQSLRSLPNDVFCQVGLVLLVGLASKNAILIVEFAEQLRREGKDPLDAAVEASTVRLRPILMTSVALIAGVTPLMVASGAGSAARVSLGTTVFGGLLASTLVNLVLTPGAYVIAQKLRRRRVAPSTL